MADSPGKPGFSRGGDSEALPSNVCTSDPNAPLVSETITEDDLGFGARGDDSHVIADSPGIAPVAASAATNAWTARRSFSHVVSSSLRPSVSSSTPSSLTASEVQRQQSTYIIRRAPPEMSPQGAVKSIAAQMRLPPGALFESALRDPHDRRRLYLVFKTPTLKQSVAAKGFKLGNVTIKPTDGALKGYIPFPPYFVDTSSLIVQLTKHGHVTSHKFITTSDGVRVAGFQFELKLKPSAIPPREIHYGGYKMAIRYSDDLRRCGFCHSYGHTVRYCRKRAAAEEERNLRATLQPDSAKTTEESLPADNPDAPATGDDPPVVSDDQLKLQARWFAALKTSRVEEATTMDELDLDYDSRLVACLDVTTKLKLDATIPDTAVELAEGEHVDTLIRQWKKEWSLIKARFREQRLEDHENFRLRGLLLPFPDELREVPLPPHPPVRTDIDPERTNNYLSTFGIISATHREIMERIRELIHDEDMPSESSDEDEDDDGDDDDADGDDADVQVPSEVPPILGPMAIADADRQDATAVPVEEAGKSETPSVEVAGNSKPVAEILESIQHLQPPTLAPDPVLRKDVFNHHTRRLTPGYDKTRCRSAFILHCDSTKDMVTAVLWNYFLRLPAHKFDFVNPAEILVVEFAAANFLVYTPTIELAHLARSHLDDPPTTSLLGITKLGPPKANKKFKEVVS